MSYSADDEREQTHRPCIRSRPNVDIVTTPAPDRPQGAAVHPVDRGAPLAECAPHAHETSARRGGLRSPAFRLVIFRLVCPWPPCRFRRVFRPTSATSACLATQGGTPSCCCLA